MNIDIRPAKSSDRSSILELDHLVATDEGRRSFIIRSLKQRNALVAVDGPKLLGYAVFDYSFYEYGFISMLFIDPMQRRRGLGEGLISQIESICETQKLFTSTNQSNKPMRKLLKKLGYVRSGFIENLDDADPEVVYFKRLSE